MHLIFGVFGFDMLVCLSHQNIEDEQSWARSRLAAKDLLDNPSTGDHMTVIEARFLEPHSILKDDVCKFAGGGSLGTRLRRELLSYGLSLLVLKRLESRHHLVSQKAGFGRAASVPAISAEIRRMQNRDLVRPEFEQHVGSLMDSLGELTDLPFSSRSELIDIVTGQLFRGLHENLELQANYFKRFRDRLRFLTDRGSQTQRDPDYDLKMEHVCKVLVPHKYYALPNSANTKSEGNTDMCIFQVMALRPCRRMYVQRAAHMAEDVTCHDNQTHTIP